jgi:branched-chain amino acid transport system permease protein
VGEDYHPLLAKDFAPYLEKVRGYEAEVIISGDFSPDSDNLIKQSGQLGMKIPMAGPFLDNPNPLKVIGGPAGAGFVVVTGFDRTSSEARRFVESWNTRWKTWESPPYDSDVFKWPGGDGAVTTMATYWVFHVVEQAGSTDPERVIEALEGSEYEVFGHPAASMYVSQALHGLTYGMLLFLVASGLTLIFGMMGVLNFAHASFFMLAGYLSYQVLSATGNFWLALLLAPIAVGLIGILMERFLLRTIQARGLGHMGELLLTVGVALVISEAVKVFWGTDSLVIAIPGSLSGTVSLVGLEYPVYRLFIVGLSSAVLCLLALILFSTRLGTIVRAVVADADMVSALGINVPRVSMLVCGIGTWMAGVAGVAAAPLLTVFPGMAEQMSLDAFVVVVVGGLGSLPGALVVALILGELNAFGIQFIPRLAPVLMFAFMALVLSFRPMGFFGERK